MKTILAFGPFSLDVGRGILRRGNDPISLPPKVFAALCILAKHHDEVVSKRTLIEAIWPDSYVEESNLTQTIFLLRKALGRTETGGEFVETLSKRGYRLAVPVEVLPIATPARAETGPIDSASSMKDDVASSSDESTEAQPKKPQEPSSSVPTRAPDLPYRSRLAESRFGNVSWAAWAITFCVGVLVLAGVGALLRPGHLTWEKPALLGFTRLTNDGMYKEHLISLLSDGSRIYFSEDVDAASYLAEVSVEGGETTRRKGPSSVASALSFSRARNEILFGSLWEQSPSQQLVAVSVPEGTTHAVAGLSGHAASWSPDSSQIAFAKGTVLYTASADGSNVHAIAQMPEAPYWPRWSPDGKRIRFSLPAWSRNVALWEVQPDGQGLHPLFPQEPWGKNACCGDWTPDGRYYVFVIDEARRSSLWVVRDEHGGWQPASVPVQLAGGPVDFWRAPLVAPDGKHVFALGEQARGELMKYDPGSRAFQPYLGGLSTDTIAFSRDGQWMAYTAYPEGTLWRSRVDGSERLRLTAPSGLARFPQWSPDGAEIVYISAEASNLWKIYKVSAKGGEPEALVQDSTNQGVATWSPDGRIAFGQIVVFGVSQSLQQIRILDIKQRKVTVVPGSKGLWTARWSPDGRYLAAMTTDNRKLMLHDFRTGTWSELANVGANDVVWSRDGEDIYLNSSDEATIYRVNVKSRQLRKYIGLEGMRRAGFFGLTLNMAPDNNPVLLREAGIHEVYSLQVRLP